MTKIVLHQFTTLALCLVFGLAVGTLSDMFLGPNARLFMLPFCLIFGWNANKITSKVMGYTLQSAVLEKIESQK